MEILRVEGLRKTYPTREGDKRLDVLGGISFSLPENQILSVVGPSGCGKSTLLRIISGLDAPTSGTVEWGQSTLKNEFHAFMVFQEYNQSLFPWLTTMENLQVAASQLNLSETERKGRINHVLSATRLEGYEKFYPNELSGGMQQRLALARGLVLRPAVLLLDEPLASLDAQVRYSLEDHILSLASEFAISIILVTHDLEQALYLGDRVISLSSQPARIVDEFPVEFPEPRNQRDTKTQPEFASLRLRLHDAIAGIGVEDNEPEQG